MGRMLNWWGDGGESLAGSSADRRRHPRSPASRSIRLTSARHAESAAGPDLWKKPRRHRDKAVEGFRKSLDAL